MDNCTLSVEKLLRLLKVKHTNTYIKNSILSHPDHPSLLSIADTLDKYKIDHIEVKIEKDRFDELPTPSIVQVMVKGNSLFYIIDEISVDIVKYYNDKNKKIVIAKSEFIKIWTGVCLMAEKTTQTKEMGIEKKMLRKRMTTGMLTLIGILLAYWFGLRIIESQTDQLFVIFYALLKIIGLTMGTLLLWFEVDQYNPKLQNFCSGGKKINCGAVLNSKYASLLNGQLSLSSLGFAYFFGTLSFLIVNGFGPYTMALVAYTSLAIIPIIAISIIYQALIIKQWCKFCILIQGVLIAEIGFVLLGGVWKNSVDVRLFPILLALLTIPILIWQVLKPLLEKQKEIFVYQRGLKKIKNNPNVLLSLLHKSKKIKVNPNGLGILFTNQMAKYNIIKVCNPYCGPCAKAHMPLEELVQKGVINLQMIFTPGANDKDRKALPVRHFLALNKKKDKEKMKVALHDWYSAKPKDYNIFANKYPMNCELIQQEEKINAMAKWCNDQKITHTPTIFINGYQLPKEYTIEDLTEVLTI